MPGLPKLMIIGYPLYLSLEDCFALMVGDVRKLSGSYTELVTLSVSASN